MRQTIHARSRRLRPFHSRNHNMETTPVMKRYFLSYSGVKLPLKLLEELPPEALTNRNTWFCAEYDAAQRIVRIEKRVYGEIEMTHQYEYDAGQLLRATIQIGDDEPHTLEFA